MQAPTGPTWAPSKQAAAWTSDAAKAAPGAGAIAACDIVADSSIAPAATSAAKDPLLDLRDSIIFLPTFAASSRWFE
jgi:hypothetical protein